jgi:hypothetical protein
MKRLFAFLVFCTSVLSAFSQVRDEPPPPPPPPVEEEIAMPEPEPRTAAEVRLSPYGNPLDGKVHKVYVGGKYGFARNNELIIPAEYDYISGEKYADFILAKKQNLMGGIDEKGSVIIPFEYKQILIPDTSASTVVLARSSRGYVIMDKKGRKLNMTEYESGTIFRGNYVLLSGDKEQRMYNWKGELVFKGDFDLVDALASDHLHRKDLLVVKQGNVEGIVDYQSKTMFPFRYEKILWSTGQRIGVVDTTGRAILVDWKGREYTTAVMRKIDAPDENNLYRVAKEKWKLGLIDSIGREVLPCDYLILGTLSKASGVYKLKKEDHYGLWTVEGKIVIPFTETAEIRALQVRQLEWEPDSFGVRVVKNEVIPDLFFMSLSPARQLSLWHRERGLIVRGGFDYFNILSDKGPILAISEKNRRYVLYDLQGKELANLDTRNVMVLNTAQTVFALNVGDAGAQVFRPDGTRISEAWYQSVAGGPFPHGFFALTDNNKLYALFDPFGKRVTDHLYSKIEPAEASGKSPVAVPAGRKIIAKAARPDGASEWLDHLGRAYPIK